ncbi:proteinkinasesubdomain-containingproteinpkl/ ccin9 [Gigaspora margarita]|uniref:Proteinkinasesubdomain-containingproteinpkl/ ccin9 n=1 Tax=Gigaspora margarita TaxID=4874 RepID=A0A8H4B0Q7_GIGMA|nr:proteinkinasesubdomain-containingproteinpkl/ ccin9 [Gigaspora margarita]
MSTVELVGTPVTLWCLDKEYMNIFDIIIGTDNELLDLKKLIKEERRPRYDNFASCELILWHVDADFSATSTINDMLSDENKLINPTNTVKETFLNPKGKNIRIVIGVPVIEYSKQYYLGNDHDEEQSKNVKKIRKYPSPSSFALVNNLHEYHTHEQGQTLTMKIYLWIKINYQWTLNCIKTMANIYSGEKFRREEFHERLRELFNESVIMLVLDETSNDGCLYLNVHTFTVLYFLIEIKNEIGTGKCDPTTQAAAFYAKFYAQKEYEQILKGCNMPCFIIGLAGPWICVLGAVYVEKAVIEPLTGFEPLIFINDRTHLEKIARLFMALRMGCNDLTKYYESLSNSILKAVDSQRFFPYIRTAVNVGDFVYKERLFNDPHKLLWKAETKKGQKIIVKFSHKYNEYAHKVCYEIRKAPELFFVSNIINGFYMIIMEYVEDENETYRGVLIDFDWAGKDNVECYPSFMNPDINWPLGAEDGMKLKKEHDMYWLDVLKKTYLNN